jgi:hypothetical protein
MVLNYAIFLGGIEKADEEGAESWHEHAHVLCTWVLVVLQLNPKAVYADIMKFVNKLGQRDCRAINYRNHRLHKPIKVAHLVAVFLDEVFDKVNTWLYLWSQRDLELLLLQHLLVLEHGVDLGVLHGEVVVDFGGNVRLFHRVLILIVIF